jgi:glycosyltransferase involved in cell wall biosynthesis
MGLGALSDHFAESTRSAIFVANMALEGKKITVVLPAYNAASTLRKTYLEISPKIVDQVFLVDDSSQDETVKLARELGLEVFLHSSNRGYGANQKSCYKEALKTEADVIIMLHPDYQYSPKLIPAMASMIVSGHYDVVLGSRILGGTALAGGMPLYKFIANRLLTLVQNFVTGAKLSEYHTGYRAFTREVLERLPLAENSDNFIFDNQILLQAIHFGYRIGEISCPTRYFPEASSIDLRNSVEYGLQVLLVGFQFFLQRIGLAGFKLFDAEGRKLRDATPYQRPHL